MKYIFIDGSEYAFLQCITCGISYTVPRALFDEHRAQSGFHSCPNGHSQGWQKGGAEIDRLRRERDRLKQDAARLEDEKRAAEQRADTERQKAERLRWRVSAGVCPCCHRTVHQLARHMKSKHPNVLPLGKLA
jgi:hypothetical protein